MMPEFGRKSEQLTQLTEQLLFSARRRARGALERNSDAELRACGEVFEAMGKASEAAAIACHVLLELCERAWQSQAKRSSSVSVARFSGDFIDFHCVFMCFSDIWSSTGGDLASEMPGEAQ